MNWEPQKKNIPAWWTKQSSNSKVIKIWKAYFVYFLLLISNDSSNKHSKLTLANKSLKQIRSELFIPSLFFRVSKHHHHRQTNKRRIKPIFVSADTIWWYKSTKSRTCVICASVYMWVFLVKCYRIFVYWNDHIL